MQISTQTNYQTTWQQSRSLSGDRFGERWLTIWALTLAGYALFGKGFAYVGLPPLFIGEVVLLAGLAALVTSRGLWPAINMPIVWMLGAMAAWGSWRTLPYVDEYGVNAMRDAVIWGYGVFAIIVAAVLIASPHKLVWLIHKYRAFAKVFLIVVPCIWVLQMVAGDSLPRWPWADAPLVHAKAGDMAVHMGGITAFWIAGLAGATHHVWLTPLLAAVPLAGVKNRSGLVSFMIACIIAVSCRPKSSWAWRLGIAAVLAMTIFVLTDIRIRVPGDRREISFQQLMSNVVSVAGNSNPAHWKEPKSGD